MTAAILLNDLDNPEDPVLLFSHFKIIFLTFSSKFKVLLFDLSGLCWRRLGKLFDQMFWRSLHHVRRPGDEVLSGAGPGIVEYPSFVCLDSFL